MKKGCIIAIVVVLVLGLIIGGVGFYLIKKGAAAIEEMGGLSGIGNSAAAFALETAIQ